MLLICDGIYQCSEEGESLVCVAGGFLCVFRKVLLVRRRYGRAKAEPRKRGGGGEGKKAKKKPPAFNPMGLFKGR